MARTFRRLTGWQKDERKILNNPRALYHKAHIYWTGTYWTEFIDDQDAIDRAIAMMKTDNGKSFYWYYKKRANRRLRKHQNQTLRHWIAVGDIEDDTIIPNSKRDAQYWD